MIDLILFITFLIYAFLIFAINNITIQAIFLILNIVLMFCLKIPFKKAISNILFLTPFIIITSIINLFFGEPFKALLIAYKLIIVCNITFIFKYSFGTTRIIKTIELLFSPLKIFGINPSDLSLIINIAIIFIPTILQELTQIRNSLASKACKISSIQGLKCTSKIILTSIFKKTNDMELALKAKGFSE